MSSNGRLASAGAEASPQVGVPLCSGPGQSVTGEVGDQNREVQDTQTQNYSAPVTLDLSNAQHTNMHHAQELQRQSTAGEPKVSSNTLRLNRKVKSP